MGTMPFVGPFSCNRRSRRWTDHVADDVKANFAETRMTQHDDTRLVALMQRYIDSME